MQIEYIARISLAPRRTAKDQRYFTIGDRLLREVVVYDQRVPSCVSEIFPNGRAGEGGEILHGCRVGGGGADYDRIIHRSLFLQRIDQAGDRRTFLSDSHINTIHRVSCFVGRTLVDDRVDRDCCLSRLAVTDNQLALATSDWDHGVDCLDACLQRFIHGLAIDHARRFPLQGHLARLACDFPFPVDRVSQRVDDAAHHVFAYIDRSDASGALYGVALFDLVGRA